MRNPPMPPLPSPSEPSKPNATRRIWADETQVLTETGAGLFDDDIPTRQMPVRSAHWELPLDAPTISGPIFGSSTISGPIHEPPISQAVTRRRITRNEWTLLIAAVGIVLLLVGTVAALGILGLPGTGNAAASNPPAAVAAATATATATPAPTATATPLPPIASSYLATDTTTQGSWQSQYGSQGYVIVGDSQQLPATIQVTPANQQQCDWQDSTTDTRALQKASNPTDRIAACWYSSSTFTIDVNITDGQTYQMALYMVDWDQQSRAEIVNVLDPSTDTVLDTRSVTGFSNGEWLVWNVRGHIAIQVTNAPGSLNAVVSGLFFAPAATPGATPTTPAGSPTPTNTPTPSADAIPTDTPSQ